MIKCFIDCLKSVQRDSYAKKANKKNWRECRENISRDRALNGIELNLRSKGQKYYLVGVCKRINHGYPSNGWQRKQGIENAINSYNSLFPQISINSTMELSPNSA